MHQHISLNSSVYVWTQSPQQKAKIKTSPKRPQSTRHSSSAVETWRNGGCSAANTQSKSYSPNHIDSVQHFYIYAHTFQCMHWGQLLAQRYFNRNMEKPGTDPPAFQSLDAPCSHMLHSCLKWSQGEKAKNCIFSHLRLVPYIPMLKRPVLQG